jgi:integrase
LLTEINAEIIRTGVVGRVPTDKPDRPKRSTERRQDVPDLPRRPVSSRTVGKVYTAPDGKTFRPSLFVTLTLDSYGRVKADGTPVDPASGTDIRTSFGTRASLMLAQGTPLHVVSEILSHASIAITKDVYGHLLEGDKRAAATSMSQALFGS